MANGTQALVRMNSRRIVPSRPGHEWPARTAPPNGDSAHPTGNWRARITIAGTNDRIRPIVQQTAVLRERIERWLTVEGLLPEVARIEAFEGRVTVIVTCSSRCKHRLRTAFPDLEVTSGDLRVAHCI